MLQHRHRHTTASSKLEVGQRDNNAYTLLHSITHTIIRFLNEQGSGKKPVNSLRLNYVLRDRYRQHGQTAGTGLPAQHHKCWALPRPGHSVARQNSRWRGRSSDSFIHHTNPLTSNPFTLPRFFYTDSSAISFKEIQL